MIVVQSAGTNETPNYKDNSVRVRTKDDNGYIVSMSSAAAQAL